MYKLGKISKEPEGFQVVFERQLPYDVATVWDTLTKPEKLAIWFLEVEMDFEVGGKMIIRFPDEAQTETTGKITQLVHGRLFEFLWEDELVRWDLASDGASGCLLKLTHSRVSADYMPSAPAGWHIMLDQLQETLDGRTTPFPFSEEESAEQKQLKAGYSKQLSLL